MVWRWNYSRIKVFTLLTALFLFFSGTTCFAEVTFSTKKITLGTKTLVVEVAETPPQHERGLMMRDVLDQDQGMLSIFENTQTRFFWMKNTLIDLSIGFFDQSGKLIDIQEMKSGKGVPDTALPTYSSAQPAKYALEMNAGWFAKNKIKMGTKLKVK